jgi:hypothetical protein
MPVIEINFNEVKNALTETLGKYKGIVVTEETLSGCKATQKDLAGMRIQIDNYRKDKKKVLEQPIKAFEEQCKELIALVEMAEAPIKEGIKVFDDVKRLEKQTIAERLIIEVSESLELEPKYASQLTVSEKYCNLTAKESEVKNDLENRAMVLRSEQDKEHELLEIIKDTIEIENKPINAKMGIDDFQRMILSGVSTRDILAEVKQRALKIFEAENPKIIESVEVITIVEPIVLDPIETISEVMYFAEYRITGSLQELRDVSKSLQDKKITYKVINQGKI